MPDSQDDQEQLEEQAEVTEEQPEQPATAQAQSEESPATEEQSQEPAVAEAPARPRRRTPRTGAATGRQRSRAAAAVVDEPAPVDDQVPPPRMLDLFRNEIVPSMMREFGFTNPMEVPRIQKIVVNIGLGEALTNGRAMESATRDLATITGQKPIITLARNSVAGFARVKPLPDLKSVRATP